MSNFRISLGSLLLLSAFGISTVNAQNVSAALSSLTPEQLEKLGQQQGLNTNLNKARQMSPVSAPARNQGYYPSGNQSALPYQGAMQPPAGANAQQPPNGNTQSFPSANNPQIPGGYPQSAYQQAYMQQNPPVPGFQQSANALRPFGEQLFSSGLAPYSVVSDMPVPLDYTVGIGDIVELRLFGKENRSLNLPVDRTGSIVIPDIGPIQVAGMSFESVGKVVLERIAKQKIGVEATVSMGPLRSIQVNLVGEVNNPGAYATDALTTVVNALLLAGGVKPSGSMRKIEIRRAGAVVTRVDLYDVILKGADKAGLRLQSGDVIFVPSVGKRVAVAGDVLRPAIYELLREHNVEDLVKLAGGVLPTAYVSQTKLDRVDATGGRQIVDISLNVPQRGKFELKDGDIINVPSVVARWDKSITLSGALGRIGAHEWKEGLSLGDVIRSPEDLARDAYRPLAVIERTDPISGARRLRTVNLLDVMSGKIKEPLSAMDKVFVLSATDIEFLSSAAVQSVLAGRLPPDERQTRSGLLQIRKGDASDGKGRSFDRVEKQGAPANDVLAANDSSAAGLAAGATLSAGDSDLPASATGQSADQKNLLATQRREEKKPICRGLVELSDVISREGAERFRAAFLPAGQGGDKPILMKSVPCTPIFEEKPELLTFVLENAITVRGEVQQPGVLPIPEGLSLDIALAARGGVTREADRAGVELSRLVDSGQNGRQVLKRHLIKAQDMAGVALEPGNVVLVKKRFSDMDVGVVRLGGEFAHPGAYEIRRGEKLSELIARAGGLTPQAYSPGTVFMRKSVKEEKKQFYQRAALELQNGLLFAITRQRTMGTAPTGADSLVNNLVDQMRNMDPVGRVVVESDPAILQVRPELDLVLEAGDEVFIPRRPSSILVMGEVLNPGAVQFQSGKKASDYIAAAGGVTGMADQDRIFAILPNGTAEPIKISSWNFMPKLLPPGSTIYVSRDVAPMVPLDIVTLSLTMFKDLALAAASLSVISK